MKQQTRRNFIKHTLFGGAGLAVLPNIITGCSTAPRYSANRLIQVAQIGCGRMGMGDMEAVMGQPLARVVAVCDLDSKRLAGGRDRAARFYTQKGESNVNIATYADYRELLARPEIDAVIVSTPDHWHAVMAIEAALARKHLYVQKPLTYAINEAIGLRNAVKARRVILQTGSQQRSERPYAAFRVASEAARNGRIGKVHTVRIGVGLDRPSGRQPATQAVPANLDYERWLGPAPQQPYMEGRVHPQNGLGRPGWITTEDFGLGMITNWGAHHIDIAQWGIGMELSGPTQIEGRADFMTNDIWTVHRTYHVEMLYPNGVNMILDHTFENGIRFEGEDGWVFCQRGRERVTASDPNSTEPEDPRGPLRASNPKFLQPAGDSEKRWPASANHYANWVDSMVANRQPIAPVDQAARSLQTCAAAWIAMKLNRKVTWDPARENFGNDREANALCERVARKPEYDFRQVMKQAGVRV